MQFDLFADEKLPSIPGLIYQADFLTPEEETGLLEIIATLPLMPARYKEYESKVRILSFGGFYDFNTHTVKPSPRLDARLVPLRNRVADWLRIEHGTISHLLVTEYLPGTQLGWHRDVPVYETIVSISLGNPATIRFRPWPPNVLTSRRTVSLEVMPRSIYKLDGEARWGWQHAVPPVKYPRWSITIHIVFIASSLVRSLCTVYPIADLID